MTEAFSPGASGAEMVAAVRVAAQAAGKSISEFALPLNCSPVAWLKQVERALVPKAHTVARINAFLAGEPIPAPLPNNFQASARRSPLVRASGQIDPPIPDVPRINREPCWRCGVRGDLGCQHRPAGEAW